MRSWFVGVSAGTLGGEVVRRLALLIKARGLQRGGDQVQLLCLTTPSSLPDRSWPARRSPPADSRFRRHDLWLVWIDKEFDDFRLVSTSADAGLVAFRWSGCEASLGAEPLRLGARKAGPAPRPWSTAARQGGRVATGRTTAFPAPVGSERIGNPTQVLGK